MKFSKRILLLTLVTSLFLVGCGDEGGFSISKTDDQSTALQQTSTMGDDMKEEEQESVSAISSSGTTNGEPEEVPHTDKEPTTSAPSTEAATPAVDLGNQITTFVFTFVNSNEEMYANVSFEDDPFDSKYDFAYYTVNDQKLEKSDFHEKQIVDGVETYKIYFGSNESGTYVLKFYNSSEKQYGRVNVSVKFDNANYSTPYISVAFNLVRIRFVSLTFSIQNVLKKIENFFSNLFSENKMSL